MIIMVTKELLAKFRADMEAAMAVVYAKHNLTASNSKIMYGSDTFKVSFEVGLTAAVGTGNPVYYKGTERHGYAFGVKTEQIGKIFKTRGVDYIFEGINQTGHFAVGKKVADGKSYKIKAEELRAAVFV
jgi:hypothetical protein